MILGTCGAEPNHSAHNSLTWAAMKMRQSLRALERAFVEETALDRDRRESLRRTAERRAAKRRSERAKSQGKARFTVLSLTLIATAVIVTVVMFRVLYLILE